jgi:hypothetical protein
MFAFLKTILAELRSLNNNLQKHSDAIAEATEATKTYEHKTPEVRAVLNFPEGVQADKKAADSRTERYQNRNLLLAWLTFGALFVYACTTIGIYIATYKAAKAAEKAATAAQQSITTARELFQKDQRPYLWYSVIKPCPIARDKIMCANIHFVNYGKSPAIREHGRGQIFFGKDALQQGDTWFAKLPPKTPEGVATSIVPPGIPTEVDKAPFSSIFSDKTATISDLGYIVMHDAAVVWVAREEYYDISGNFYTSEICVLRLANGLLGHCEKHNEIK